VTLSGHLTFPEYESHDALGLARLVARREVSPHELLDAALARIGARDGALGAIVLDLADEAEDGWVAYNEDWARATLRYDCSSWYLGANVPGKPRVFMPFVGGLPVYINMPRGSRGQERPVEIIGANIKLT